MIDFELTQNDKKVLDTVRAEALACRAYARHYDENEHEFPPDELPEAKDFPPMMSLFAGRGPEDTGLGVMSMMIAAGQSWGDYSVRMRRGKGGLGNAALRAAGTPEQQKQWGHLTLAMAITEPGCGSDPSRVAMTAVLDADTNEWILNGEKIFVTTGCRAEGVVVWATVDKSAGRAGIKSFLVEKGAPGFIVAHKEKKLGIRADDTAAYVFKDCRIPRGNLLGGNEEIPKESSGGFRGVMKTFNMTRPAVAAIGLGIAQAALDWTREQLEAAGIAIEYGGGLAGAVRDRAALPRARGALRRRDADGAARRLALGPGQAQQPRVVDLQGEGRSGRARDHAGLHRAARSDGRFARAPAREVVPRRAHHRHLRGHRPDPAPDHRAPDPRLRPHRAEVIEPPAESRDSAGSPPAAPPVPRSRWS